MKRLSLIGILIIALSNSLMAFSDKEIADALKRQAKISNIDAKILYTIAKIESGLKPLVISFISDDTNLKIDGLKMTTMPYGKKFIVALRGKKANLIKIAKTLIKDGFSIDVGLMQINSQNFKANEIEQMFELDYNIKKATRVLNLCADKYSTMASVIECYNKGYRKMNTLAYYDRFKKSFLKDFAGVKL